MQKNAIIGVYLYSEFISCRRRACATDVQSFYDALNWSPLFTGTRIYVILHEQRALKRTLYLGSGTVKPIKLRFVPANLWQIDEAISISDTNRVPPPDLMPTLHRRLQEPAEHPRRVVTRTQRLVLRPAHPVARGDAYLVHQDRVREPVQIAPRRAYDDAPEERQRAGVDRRP
ncbi:hypothetical protein HYPSUDRAFT_1084328 [Hypholoma sublateritium FD-334 SS-4]|uniref:Uncharacterized protein n=1 Tax=Hypholoma sublateritium (strain FD-334 SS-4) TaxID=945553 RepID=A0A0D2L6G7_HYPSF|nr:hypothetical protein HYPSUDRAFT_1084328 [Hypholoma sublateritium FD-334 SS-4]